MAHVEEHVLKLRDLFSGPLLQAQKRTESFRRTVGRTEKSVMSLGKTFNVALAAFAGQQAISGLIKIGGEFEQIGVRLETFTGSAVKGQKVMQDLTDFAAKTPFDLIGVSQSAGQLLAAGAATEELIPTLKALGDVAAGTGTPLERIILNFNQVRSQGKLTGRELRDFAVAQIPILQVLADQFGTTTSQIQKMTSEGKIGFKDVEQAFTAMTSKGGIFFNLMDKQSKTTVGRISNLKDVFDTLVNDIFVRLQPEINSTIDALSDMVDTFKENVDVIVRIIKLLKTLFRAFLIFKTVVFILKAARVAMVAFRVATIAAKFGTVGLTRAMKAMNIAFVTSPIGLIAGVVTLLATAFFELAGDVDEATGSVDGFNKSLRQTQKLQELLIGATTGFINPNTGELITGPSGVSSFQKQVTELNREELQELQTILSTKVDELTRELKNIDKNDEIFINDFRKRIDESNSLLRIVNKEIGKFGTTSTGGGVTTTSGNKLGTGLAEVRSAAPKVFNINIEKQIEELSFVTQNLQESKEQVKEELRAILLETINDVQLIGSR